MIASCPASSPPGTVAQAPEMVGDERGTSGIGRRTLKMLLLCRPRLRGGRRLLGGCRIDALALNAGIQTVSGDQMSADGRELSFAVNFLAHFLIVERLKGLMRPGGRIVTTSSEVHDPDAFCLMGIGRATWQDPLDLADPARSQAHIASLVDRGGGATAPPSCSTSCTFAIARVAGHQRGSRRSFPVPGGWAGQPGISCGSLPRPM